MTFRYLACGDLSVHVVSHTQMSEDKVNAAQKRSKSKSEIKPRKRDILSLVKADARLGLYRSLSSKFNEKLFLDTS